jgi:protein-S-isoprenylcysteine O-methyltransferase Ste14
MSHEFTQESKVRSLRFAGYLIPLLQSLPPLGVWTGLMTLPFVSYLAVIFANLPTNLPKALSELFSLFPALVSERTFVIVGLLIIAYSAVYLRVKRKEGLVTGGPYQFVRHPQYLGMIISTLGLTSWSVWILSNTFGIGFLNQSQTIAVWFIELFAYIFLAYVEELFLSRNYGEAFEDYRSHVPLLILFSGPAGNI